MSTIRSHPQRPPSRAPVSRGLVIATAGLALLVVIAAAVLLTRTDPTPSDEAGGAVTGPDAGERAHAERPPTPPPGEAAEIDDEDTAAIEEVGEQIQEANEEQAAPVEDSVEDIERWQERLARRIAAGRAATRGDLLTPRLVAYLTSRTEAVLAGPDGDRVLAVIRDADPTRDGDAKAPMLTINAVYPEDQPLSTVPPSLLAVYPALPDGIEYRFVGCRLILLERDAGLVLDYTEECML